MELSDIEKEKLGRFWNDEVTREALRKFIVKTFGNTSVTSPEFLTLNSLELGRKVKTIQEGLGLFQKGFNQLNQFAGETKTKKKGNPAI